MSLGSPGSSFGRPWDDGCLGGRSLNLTPMRESGWESRNPAAPTSMQLKAASRAAWLGSG